MSEELRRYYLDDLFPAAKGAGAAQTPFLYGRDHNRLLNWIVANNFNPNPDRKTLVDGAGRKYYLAPPMPPAAP